MNITICWLDMITMWHSFFNIFKGMKMKFKNDLVCKGLEENNTFKLWSNFLTNVSFCCQWVNNEPNNKGSSTYKQN